MALKISVIREAPRALLTLIGSLDHESVRVLRLKAQSALATGHRFLLLDLSDLTSLDEAGAEGLRYVHRIYSIAGGRLVLAGLDLDLEACLLRYGGDDVLRASARPAA
jgi:anti-anti-sigma regulatory factor